MPLVGEYEPSSAEWVRNQVDLYERSGGMEGTTLRDMPVIILTSRGASSGKLRKTPLMRVEHDGVYAVVASQGGAPTHPLWYYNLVGDPHVELQDGPERSDRMAREVSGDERELWWQRAVAAYPDYADYQVKTDRQIPVFVLEPHSRLTVGLPGFSRAFGSTGLLDQQGQQIAAFGVVVDAPVGGQCGLIEPLLRHRRATPVEAPFRPHLEPGRGDLVTELSPACTRPCGRGR